MSEPSKPDRDTEIRRKIIGLGEDSIHKSYYPELQQRLADLERFRALIDQSLDLICIFHLPDGQIQETNRSIRKFYKMNQEDIEKLSVYDLTPPNYIEEIRSILTHLNHQTNYDDLVLRLPDQAGNTVPFEFSLTTYSWQNGKFVISIGRDISERLEKEKRIKKQMQHLDYLHQIDLSITNYNKIDATLQTILGILIEDLGVEAACFSIHSPESMTLKGLSCRGLTPWESPPYEQAPHPFKKAATINHLREKAVSVNHPIVEQVYPEDLDGVKKAWVYVAMGLQTQGVQKGLLEAYLEGENLPDEEWLNFFVSICTQATVAIDHAQIMDDLRSKNIELEKTYDSTLEGWALALELREKETSQHTHRVAEITTVLAEKLGFSPQELVHIRRGALLHDIGKMGIPDEILLKPGPLTDEEWTVMRMHPDYARGMLDSIPFLRPVIDIPYAHHEKWDGTGYPRGLAGTQIPLAARLFSLVDVWDALLSDRPYRKAWKEADVMDYIKRQSGSSFDPELVEFFLASNIKHL